MPLQSEQTPFSPQQFNVRQALEGVLHGENPQAIFSLTPGFQLTEQDLDIQYGMQPDHGPPHDWRKKALVNTLRAACGVTIAGTLQHLPIHIPLLQDTDTISSFRVNHPLRLRAEHVFDQIRPLTQAMMIAPNLLSPFERTLQVFSPYVGTDLATARAKVAQRMAKESLTRSLVPMYLELLFDVYKRDYDNYDELSFPLTCSQFRSLALHSTAILLRDAAATLGYHKAYLAYMTQHIFDIWDAYRSEHFELQKKSGHSKQWYVRMWLDAAKGLNALYEEKFAIPQYSVLMTGCPSLVRLQNEGQTILYSEQSLIETVVYRSVSDI